ncbi:IclR family transcriptional regulator [Microbacterium sp. Sa4CUA7]|uniref:IclR family transcriptional regulator n=1 Tax=Microbacterium pullorum TaxID=2762236 RepID=A0ABR8S2M3_9MICO|nr:IclR family transcriptional regulator [Microbacterium pullorum]MBD7957604.1 IclR family transcriptional regulator [Microbacterium pullorum]
MTENIPTPGVQSVVRTLDLLETLAALGGEAGVGEIAAALSLPPPTVHRILRTLAARGYVMQLPSRRYSLGPGLIRLGEAATRRLSGWAKPALVALSAATQESANLAVLDGDMATYIAQSPSKHQMRMFTEVGRRVFPHATGVGKALLAQLPDADALALARRTGMPGFTDTTLRTEDDLLAELSRIRSRGYAVDEGEQEVGVRCFAVAVPGMALPAAVSVSGPEVRVTLESAPVVVQALHEAVATLQRAVPG